MAAAKRTVIVLDDDDLTLERVARSLRGTGWEAICFSEPEPAMERLKESPAPDVLIVDNRMPRIDGVDFLAQLARDNELPATRSYLCSGVTPPTDVTARTVRLGARVLAKEVLWDDEQFLAELNGVLAA